MAHGIFRRMGTGPWNRVNAEVPEDTKVMTDYRSDPANMNYEYGLFKYAGGSCYPLTAQAVEQMTRVR
jgi:hypothetical protein